MVSMSAVGSGGHVAPAPVRVLIVEDDEDLSTELAGIFTGAGYLAGTVGNGLDALAAIEALPPDLLLLDLGLPGMSGRELITRLDADPRLARIPRLLMTGAQNAWDSSGLGPVFVVKPLRAADLLRATRLYLGR